MIDIATCQCADDQCNTIDFKVVSWAKIIYRLLKILRKIAWSIVI